MSAAGAPGLPDAPDAGPVARLLPWLLAAGGALGLLAATALLVEKVRVLQDPGHVPSCSINPVLSCGTVMQTWQAEVFGVPNPVLGVVGFSVVTTVGVALLAGARFPRWFHLGLWAGTLFGAVFVHWLIFQSLYRIGALCPYCMAVWAVAVPLFWYTTLDGLREGRLPGAGPRARRAAEALSRFHSTVPALWAVGVALLAAWTFRDHWAALL
ncbi:vitamin K epoxide reductase family protein [Nocardiopsis flavescens]